MNTNARKTTLIAAATIAAALLAGPAVAGGQFHRMPADYGKMFPTYEIRIVNVPSGRTTPLTIQVINKETGELVTNADVTMRHRHWLGIKGVPQFQYVQLALKPDGRGDYVCPNGALFYGDKIILRAQIPGEPSATWVTLAANQ
ncbi:MAG: hypothetical protein KGJ49_13985 [Alphaproteobacteria bacterium]|nr:hypothetical protein [Alphaproteobacteria bacterium]